MGTRRCNFWLFDPSISAHEPLDYAIIKLYTSLTYSSCVLAAYSSLYNTNIRGPVGEFSGLGYFVWAPEGSGLEVNALLVYLPGLKLVLIIIHHRNVQGRGLSQRPRRRSKSPRRRRIIGCYFVFYDFLGVRNKALI